MPQNDDRVYQNSNMCFDDRTDKDNKQAAPKEADPCTLAREKFGAEPNITALCEDSLSLYGDQKWVIWENIDYTTKKDSDWENRIRRVAWFDNMINFHQVWNNIPHATLSNVMYDAVNQSFNT